MEEERITKLIREYDADRLKKEQMFQLILSFVISACLIVPASFLVSSNLLFMFPIFYGIVYFIWWPFVFIYALRAMRRPLRKIEIDTEAGTITVNDDVYDLHKQQIYVSTDPGVIKLLHYGCITFSVIDGSDKKLASYFVGPAFGKYSKKVREEVKKILPLYASAFYSFGCIGEIIKEKEESLDIVRVELPADSIRNTLYKTGNIFLVFTAFAYAFSYLPQKFYEEEQFLIGGFQLLRNLSVILMVICLIYVLACYTTYKKLARTIEVSPYKIKINDEVFLKSEIRRIRIVPGIDDPDYKDEGFTWMYIEARGRMHRYFLGQTKNKDCFEPRKKLKGAINLILANKTPK